MFKCLWNQPILLAQVISTACASSLCCSSTDSLFEHCVFLRLLCAQTSIVTDGFRSLKDGEDVEFFEEQGGDGRRKAVQVTGPNGAPPIVSPHAAFLPPASNM